MTLAAQRNLQRDRIDMVPVDNDPTPGIRIVERSADDTRFARRQRRHRIEQMSEAAQYVESLGPMNLLVNYWWHPGLRGPDSKDSAFDALLHGIVSIRDLPPATRAAGDATEFR